MMSEQHSLASHIRRRMSSHCFFFFLSFLEASNSLCVCFVASKNSQLFELCCRCCRRLMLSQNVAAAAFNCALRVTVRWRVARSMHSLDVSVCVCDSLCFAHSLIFIRSFYCRLLSQRSATCALCVTRTSEHTAHIRSRNQSHHR